MEADRQEAYRHLLYSVFLHLRSGRSDIIGWNVLSWKRAASRLCVNQAIADYFHNLALFSVRNFDGFNEKTFWEGIEHLGKKHGSELTDRYRRIFEEKIGGRYALF